MIEERKVNSKNNYQEKRIIDYNHFFEESENQIHNPIEQRKMIYNNQGKRIEISNCGENHIIKHDYEYDLSGNLISETDYCGDDIFSWHEYRYDNFGKLIQKLSYINNGCENRIDYIYDSRGHLVEEKDFHDNDLLSFHQYSYNTDNKVSEHVAYLSKDRIAFVHRFEYDNMGRLFNRQIFENNGSEIILKEKHQFLYNAHGDVEQQVWITPDGQVHYRHIYRYEYDERGNKTKFSVFSSNGEIEQMIHHQECEYKYFD